MGEAVRYDGGDCLHHLSLEFTMLIQQWKKKGLLLPLCPEVAGGLSTPRPAAEIQGDKVMTVSGEDVSLAFESGAQAALNLCQTFEIKLAILKESSPSCGLKLINDGTFSKQKIAGQGITAQLLLKHGIKVFNEFQLDLINQDEFFHSLNDC